MRLSIKGELMALNTLSDREWQVLQLVAQGESNKSIAKVLSIAEHTVEHHLTHIYEKLGVSGRIAASSWYWRSQMKNSGFPLLQLP